MFKSICCHLSSVEALIHPNIYFIYFIFSNIYALLYARSQHLWDRGSFFFFLLPSLGPSPLVGKQTSSEVRELSSEVRRIALRRGNVGQVRIDTSYHWDKKPFLSRGNLVYPLINIFMFG